MKKKNSGAILICDKARPDKSLASKNRKKIRVYKMYCESEDIHSETLIFVPPPHPLFSPVRSLTHRHPRTRARLPNDPQSTSLSVGEDCGALSHPCLCAAGMSPRDEGLGRSQRLGCRMEISEMSFFTFVLVASHFYNVCQTKR